MKSTNEIKKEISKMIAEMEEQNEWGGSEDGEGNLYPGGIDWEEVREKIEALPWDKYCLKE